MEKIYLDKLESKKKEYLENNNLLQDPNTLSDPKKYADCSKKEKQLFPTVELYDKYLNLLQENRDVLEIISTESDQNLIQALKEQKNQNDSLLSQIEEKLISLLKERDPLDERVAIFEIEGAVGGDEANIFAGDLFWMYQKYCVKNGFKVEVIDSEEAEHGGYSHISFEVTGDNAYGRFKYESGVHRVQRIPATESKGRVHTSTASVLVLPKAEAEDVTINPTDLKIDTYKSGGAGGQHVNKTESAIRITHIPTGIVVASQEGRSQHANRDRALELIRTKIFQQQIEKAQELENTKRKLATGSRERSDKIRTYNYPDNRVTDHRIGVTLNKLDRIIDGSALDEILDAIASYNPNEE